MSEIINGVWELCNKFIVNGKGESVTICEEGISKVAEDIKEKLSKVENHWWGYPKCLNSSNDIDYKMLCYELIADSINYNYWYGRYDIRPNGACANKMYELLDNCVSFSEKKSYMSHGGHIMKKATQNFIIEISRQRFPNLENRIKHLNEVLNFIEIYEDKSLQNISRNLTNNKLTVHEFLNFVISYFPGYASDMFLKRAFLLPIMLYRRVGWFKDEINIIPIPADYQIPKMLEGLGCIRYNYLLAEKIENAELIPEGSIEECEIRSATMLAGKRLAELSGKRMCDVDTYLWLKRREIDRPFHLTITTNY